MMSIVLYLGMALFCALWGTDQHPAAAPGQPKDSLYYTMEDFLQVEKTDAHVHINTSRPDFMEQAARDHFRAMTVNYDDPSDSSDTREQEAFALDQIRTFPGRVGYACSFSTRNFNDPGWVPETINSLSNSFSRGAAAVKIYKVIGMSLRDGSGRLVMIDDPRLAPVLDFIAARHMPVLGHLGEPRNCWLPAEEMTIAGDRNYFTQHPEYHMYLHPEFPGYQAQIASRDHMLEMHPNLRFVGAHLGSLEWNVDELARRLDRFPNMAVDLAARITHLQYQAVRNRSRVRDFMIRYQDRLIYATDMGAGPLSGGLALGRDLHATWLSDWKFFVTQDNMQVPDVDSAFSGLHLPRSVIDKIYRLNARAWYPRLFREAPEPRRGGGASRP